MNEFPARNCNNFIPGQVFDPNALETDEIGNYPCDSLIMLFHSICLYYIIRNLIRHKLKNAFLNSIPKRQTHYDSKLRQILDNSFEPDNEIRFY